MQACRLTICYVWFDTFYQHVLLLLLLLLFRLTARWMCKYFHLQMIAVSVWINKHLIASTLTSTCKVYCGWIQASAVCVAVSASTTCSCTHYSKGCQRTHTSTLQGPYSNNRLLLLLQMIIVNMFVGEIDCVEIYDISILLQQLLMMTNHFLVSVEKKNKLTEKIEN